MTFRVVLQRLAVRDLGEAYHWAARNAPLTAARWLDRFQAALATLADNPERCPLARENSKVDVELREYLFGRRPHVYRSSQED
jgi:plasmid stabilization system protein ParE